jgi:UDP-N-acetylglucosamine:LPS N-acetylglucosamine transferase
VRELLHNPARLEAMRRAAGTLARPQAAAEIARRLEELAGPEKDVSR